ncbi:Fis family transcriptional regulator [Klebsiella variicola]|nr:Fis family transcriptional regulator [Klebsiella variicola]
MVPSAVTSIFRLNVISLPIPPLRERKEDLRELVEWFCEKISRALKRNCVKFSDSALSHMENYDWPGNVRELENIVERTINLTEADVINDKDLPDELQNSVCSALAVHDGRTKSYNLKDSEKMIIERCLMEKKGNLRQVAIALNLSRGALYNKLKRYDIEANEYRKHNPEC